MLRRDFLKTIGAVTVTLSVPRFAFALGSEKRYFVLIRMTGGWDVTLGLDPKVHAPDSDQSDMFIEYKPDEILKVGALSLGPAMEPMKRHAGGLSVVNGLITSAVDNGHTASLEYMSTGNGEGKAPYIPIELAVAGRKGSLGLVFTGQTSALNRDVMTTTTQNVEDLKRSLNLANFAPLIGDATLKDDFYRAERAMIGDAQAVEALTKSMDAAKVESETDPIKRAGKVIASAFAAETAFQGQIDMQLNLDTHSSHEKTHLQVQTQGWEQIASVFDQFKSTPIGSTGQSLFDATTFLVISEFARTPALNAALGKDHNPLTNSALLAGGGIKGDVTFGASHLITRKKAKSGVPSHTALPIEMSSGRPAATRADAESGLFTYLTPEILVATVAQSQNVDWSLFHSVPQTTPTIKTLLK